MVKLTQIGSAGSAAGFGVCALLAGCSGTQSLTIDQPVDSSDTQIAEEPTPVDTPSGPQSGDINVDIDATVVVVEQELQALEQLEPKTLLAESQISIDFHVEPEDYRSVGDTILEVESTSDDGHYVIGRMDQTLVARISLTCADATPGDLLITDLAGRLYAEEWVPLVDRLVPSFVAASGCEPALLGSPTDCLDLPDDPAGCIPNEGVETNLSLVD